MDRDDSVDSFENLRKTESAAQTQQPNEAAPSGKGNTMPPKSAESRVDDDDTGSDEGNNISSRTSTRLVKFQLFETKARFYILGSNQNETHNRILKIDRTVEPGELGLVEDDVIYTRKGAAKVLNAIDAGNKATGGLQKVLTAWGIIGFIRFTAGYYMSVITKRSPVALLGGHYVYHIDETRLIPLASVEKQKQERNSEEARYLSTLDQLDISKTFYFSYSYDITRTLQSNILRQRELFQKGEWYGTSSDGMDYNDMFVWNHFLLKPGKQQPRELANWCLPIIHGFVDQAKICLYGRSIYVCVIARRSRYFAGARFLKRGVNDKGYVANEVETEQIVSELLTTSFHGPGGGPYENPHWTSYVQHRGSIPLYWMQDVASMTPKPPIELTIVDPFFSAAALHFNQMFERYGIPIIALSLIKQKEKIPRESILGNEYEQCIKYLNQFLPTESQIQYITWDMARAAKSRDQDVIATLETIADKVLSTTGFFHNGMDQEAGMRLQQGVCRTNCVDCLDRTNACQFIIAKRALGQQLFALGIIDNPDVPYETDAVNLLTEMFHDHGDTIALQYGGSHLVNTMETYRKTNQWSSHSRDMIESIRRFYSNSFVDGGRQEAINLFLGNYKIEKGQPTLWELTTDYYLHHIDPRFAEERRRSYIQWYDPKNLETKAQVLEATSRETMTQNKRTYKVLRDEMWQEYYRPSTLSSIQKIFSYNMNSTIRTFHSKSRSDIIKTHCRHDKNTTISPFRPQKLHVERIEQLPPDTSEEGKPEAPQKSRISFYKWLGQSPEVEDPKVILDVEIVEKEPVKEVRDNFKESSDTLAEKLLDPKVSPQQTKEYEYYIAHAAAYPKTTYEEPDPFFTTYVENGYNSTHTVSEKDLKIYEAHVLSPEKSMVMRATLFEKDDDVSRRKAQGFQTWLKGFRKLEKS